MPQIQIAKPFQTAVPNINLHLKAIYAEGELHGVPTIKSYLTVRTTRRLDAAIAGRPRS